MQDIGEGWKLVNDGVHMPLCVKRLGKVSLHVHEGVNGGFTLQVFHNKYISYDATNLKSKDWESACNEADDEYRAILTKAVEYLTEQVKLLPEI